MTRILKTLALCLAAAIALPACAHDRHHGHYHTNNDDILGALIVGGVIGSVIANQQREVIIQQQPVIVQQPPVVIQPHPTCWREALYDSQGRFVTYRKVCQ